MFFTTEENKQKMQAFLGQVRAFHHEDVILKKRMEMVHLIIKHIQMDPVVWDERCSYNITLVGSQFMGYMQSFDSSEQASEDQINGIYALSFRFLCEYDFMISEGKEFSSDINEVFRYIQNEILEIDDGRLRSQLIYAS